VALAAATEIMVEIEPNNANQDVDLQYGPVLAETPTGGFIVAWSGDGTQQLMIAHIKRDGSIAWAVSVGSVRYFAQGSLSYIGGGNYAACTQGASAGNILVFSLANGGRVWAKSWTADTNATASADSSGAVYCGGGGYIAKLTSEGVTTWRYRWSYAGGFDQYGIAAKPAGGAVVFGARTVSSYYRAIVVSVGSDGTLLWDKYYSVGSAHHLGQVCAIGSSGEITVATPYNNGGLYETHVMRISDSDGSISWARVITYSGQSLYPRGVCTDSSGNIYLYLSCESVATDEAYLVKYNSSGTIQAQVKITTTGSTFVPLVNGGTIMWKGGFVVIGLSGVTNHIIALRISDDLATTGAVVGEDDTVTLASTSNMVDAASTITANDITATYASDSFVISSITPTVAAYTDYTTTVTAI